MKRFALIILTALLVAAGAMPGDAGAQNRVLLGERHVTDRTERDTIFVGKKHGRFSAFQVQASGAAVEFKRLVIHFENGGEQVFERNRLLGKGDTSRRIDLDGGARYIDKVVFHYEARSRGWKGADIKLFGVR